MVTNIKIINVLVAFLISLFVVFPDIILLRGFPAQSEREPVHREYSGDTNPGQQPGEGVKPPLREKFSRPWPPQESNKIFHVFPNDTTDKIIVNYAFFFVLVIILLFLSTYNLLYNKWNLKKKRVLIVSISENLFICMLFIPLHTFINQQRGVFPLDAMNVSKIFFVGIVSYLFVYVMYLIGQQQKITLENEQLRSENLLAQYNMLTAQINPHFFFNSLNSLSALVREEENEKSLRYINELSDIFRYVLKANKQGLTTLREELNFLQAYRYMMEIRYEGKLHFDIKIEEKYLIYQIPMLSVQLLIENIIKHNEISEDKPLKVNIYTTNDNMLVISNPVQKKIRAATDSGVGLQNLNNRYLLLVSESIIVDDNEGTFMVRLPLTPNLNER